MAKTATVSLAGREYVIEEARSRENAAWRTRLRVPFETLTKRLETASDTDISKPSEIVALLKETAGTLLEAPDLLAGLLFAYSPTLAADQERITAEAYDSELMAAFVEVLKLAYPFGAVAQKVSGLIRLGQTAQPTMRN